MNTKNIEYIIIPGLFGSRLYCNCVSKIQKKIFPPKILGMRFDSHFFEKSCVVTTKPLWRVFGISVYKNIFNRLGGEKKCMIFSYDWRKTPLEIAQKLKFFLEISTPFVTIIGHSNGGFILRILLEFLKYPRKNFKNVVICSTPLFGSMDPLQYNIEEKLYQKIMNDKNSTIFTRNLIQYADEEKVFKTFIKTLLYFIPSYYFVNLSLLTFVNTCNMPLQEIIEIKKVHLELSKMNCNSYVFYSNPNFKSKAIINSNSVPITKVFKNLKKLKKLKNFFQFHYSPTTDSLIVEPLAKLSSCIMLQDCSLLPHCLILNSQFLCNQIKFLNF